MIRVQQTAVFCLILLSLMVFSAKISYAIGFKLMNDSDYDVRARVQDRGRWRGWTVFTPGEWSDFAPNVERATHRIQIDIKNRGEWKPLYRHRQRSGHWTKVVQVIVSDNQVGLQWYDDPGADCRDKPPLQGHRDSSCLKTSGARQSMEITDIGIKFIGIGGEID